VRVRQAVQVWQVQQVYQVLPDSPVSLDRLEEQVSPDLPAFQELQEPRALRVRREQLD